MVKPAIATHTLGGGESGHIHHLQCYCQQAISHNSYLHPVHRRSPGKPPIMGGVCESLGCQCGGRSYTTYKQHMVEAQSRKDNYKELGGGAVGQADMHIIHTHALAPTHTDTNAYAYMSAHTDAHTHTHTVYLSGV